MRSASANIRTGSAGLAGPLAAAGLVVCAVSGLSHGQPFSQFFGRKSASSSAWRNRVLRRFSCRRTNSYRESAALSAVLSDDVLPLPSPRGVVEVVASTALKAPLNRSTACWKATARRLHRGDSSHSEMVQANTIGLGSYQATRLSVTESVAFGCIRVNRKIASRCRVNSPMFK